MYKLKAAIIKDLLVLTRDKVGLLCMFAMPILLAIVITILQNSTFELVNNNKVPLLLCNRDTGEISRQFVEAIEKVGIFKLKQVKAGWSDGQVREAMHAKDALIAIIIPENFSLKMSLKAKNVSGRALNEFGLETVQEKTDSTGPGPLTMLYHPVLQESFRQSVKGALRSALQVVETREMLKRLYFALNEKPLPEKLEDDILHNQTAINELPVSRDGSSAIPNATQHNVPAWTIFAMFFIVVSLGSSVVREKLNGSFVRLRTLPTNYYLALVSRQIAYLAVTMLQAAVIFAIGLWVFPLLGLPALNLPADLGGLFLVTLVCGWCAVSFAICMGVFAQTQEQANATGAVSIVLLAAIGGLLVPGFAMPDSFRLISKLSPLHWCLEAFYGLFLEGGKLKDVLINILPLFVIAAILQLIAVAGLKKKHLI
jgi:ABC-2 type transport system permease protein